MTKLIRMTKNGEMLAVHESTVAAHQRAGWAVSADQSDALREDGPTVAEYVTAGYLAENYPPEGYASRSTAEEIADAIKAEAEVAAAKAKAAAEAEAEAIAAAKAKEAAETAQPDQGIGTDSGEQLSDDQLRAAIETATGQKPHHLLGRAKLIEQFNALNAEAAKAAGE